MPQILSQQPGWTNTAAGTDHTIRIALRAPGTGTVTNAQVAINSVVAPPSCYSTWSRQYNSLFLADNNWTTAGYTQIPLGGGASAANSYCRVFAAGSSAVDSGEYLVLTFHVKLTPASTGTETGVSRGAGRGREHWDAAGGGVECRGQ